MWYDEAICPHGDDPDFCDKGGCDETHLDDYYARQ